MKIDWLNLLVIAGLAVGHVALFVACINRLYAIPVSDRVLDRARLALDALIVVLPLLFLWYYGVRGARLLRGGSWHAVPVPIQVYLGVCACVAVLFAFFAVRRSLAGAVPVQVSSESRVVDIAERLGYRPIGNGPYRILTYLPWNQFLKLEICTLEFRLPHLPAEWDGLSVLQISDLHFFGTPDRAYFEQLFQISATLPSDLIMFTGDLLDCEERIDWLESTFGQLKAPLGCFFVLGNHDWYLENTAEIREKLVRLGWQGVAGRSVEIEHQGRRLQIAGSEVPWMGTHPEFPAAAGGCFRILLSHTPDNYPWAKTHSVDLMLSGHNHGGQVRLPLLGAIYTPSSFGTKYAGGTFWEAPTLLHVSRGVAGRQPWRWNCLPELTRIVLRSEKSHSSTS